MTTIWFRRLAFLAPVLALGAAAIPSAMAQIEIDINEGVSEPVPVAIPEFLSAANNPRAAQAAADIAKVIRNNLTRSGLFVAIDPAKYIERISDINAAPKFGDWRVIQAQGLVSGQVTLQADGMLKVEFRLWDIFAEKQLQGLQFVTTPENQRRVGHLISDAIYQRLTGDKGYFDTRVVYIAESGPKERRKKYVAIMDQDGYNPSNLTTGDSLVLSPRFSPNSQVIAYVSDDGNANQFRIYLMDLQSGRREAISNMKWASGGPSIAPRFSPDGKRLILSSSAEGNMDIYEFDLATKSPRRLTNDPGIDTSPSYSPDGTKIVFQSDRSGSSQLYVMDASGANVRRITYGNGRYNTPVWSPRGDLIAFTKQDDGNFKIGVIRTDGQGEKILSTAFQQEGPTWAPNGRVVMFDREVNKKVELWSVDITGKNERKVPTTGAASNPTWSPLQH